MNTKNLLARYYRMIYGFFKVFIKAGEHMQLSKRMQAVADLITPTDALADGGTDHGYIPIYAVE